MKVVKETIVKPAVPAVVKKVVSEVENEGLMALIGRRVTLYCSAYIYCGTLVGVNVSCVKLEKAGIVYETGDFKSPKWANYEPFPGGDWYVQCSSIESFGVFKD